jgi:hypothetical protein
MLAPPWGCWAWAGTGFEWPMAPVRCALSCRRVGRGSGGRVAARVVAPAVAGPDLPGSGWRVRGLGRVGSGRCPVSRRGHLPGPQGVTVVVDEPAHCPLGHGGRGDFLTERVLVDQGL